MVRFYARCQGQWLWLWPCVMGAVLIWKDWEVTKYR